jgi:hypothetical protein
MDKFKWAIIVLGVVFLFILADKWVFQPEAKEARQLECAQKIRSMVADGERMTNADVTLYMSLCEKGF